MTTSNGAIVRNFLPSDVESLTALYNHYILNTAITFDVQAYSIEQRQERWLSHYALSGRYRLLVAECDRQVVGYATSSQFRKKAAYDTSVETSIYLSEAVHHQGIGSRLYHALFEALAAEDVHRAYAGITLPNEASVALHRKFGFEQVGLFRAVGRKFNRYWDVAWFEKAL